MTEQKYTVTLYEDDALVLNESGEEVQPDEVREIINHLENIYDEPVPTKIYLMYSPKMGLHKIGISNNPAQRLNNLKSQYEDKDMVILHETEPYPRREAETKEKILHCFFSHQHQERYEGRNLGEEWFKLETADVNLIKSKHLFIEYVDSFMIHPMALGRYGSENTLLNEYIRKILVMTSEVLSGTREPLRDEPTQEKSELEKFFEEDVTYEIPDIYDDEETAEVLYQALSNSNGSHGV